MPLRNAGDWMCDEAPSMGTAGYSSTTGATSASVGSAGSILWCVGYGEAHVWLLALVVELGLYALCQDTLLGGRHGGWKQPLKFQEVWMAQHVLVLRERA